MPLCRASTPQFSIYNGPQVVFTRLRLPFRDTINKELLEL